MRINCHTHVFNLRSMVTDKSLDVVKKRLEKEVQPDFLGKIAGEVAERFLRDAARFDEEEMLRQLLGELKKETGVQKLLDDKLDFLPSEVREMLEQSLEQKGLSFLRRAADSLVVIFRRRQRGDDITSKSLFNILDLLRLISRPRIRDVADHLMGQLDLDEGAVLLVMDISGDDTEKRAGTFAGQVADTTALIPAYPGRVFPFYGLHPGRPDPLGRTRRAIEGEGCVGLKIYPSTTGWSVADPALEPVYGYCVSHGLPLLQHCNDGGFYGEESDTLQADPALWRPVLNKFPGLKICFGHFGGTGGIASETVPKDHWAETILALMEEFEGVYADISAHSAPMKAEATRKVYFRNLKSFLRQAPSRDRILFGTDFWLMRVRLTEARHWRFFEENLTQREFERIAVDNPGRFLGLPDATGAGAAFAFGFYADRVARDLEKLEGPAPDWLAALVAQRHGPAKAQELRDHGDRFVPAPSLVLPAWREIVDEAAEKVLDRESGGTLGTGAVEVASTQFSGASIGLTGSGAFQVRLFADEDQRDEDGVLLPPPATAEAVTTPQVRPQIPFEDLADDHTWLKYRLSGELHLRGAGELSSVGLNLQAGKEVVFSDYRIHDRGGSVSQALEADLRRPRFALSLADVLRLGKGEALAFASRGTLAASATLSWADVVTGGLGGLSRALGLPPGVLGLRLDLSASVSARLSVTDDFRVVFSRRRRASQGREFGVAVVKMDAREAAARVAVGAQLRMENPQAFQALVGQLLEQRLGSTMTKVEKLLGRTQEADLDKTEKNLLKKLEDELMASGLKAVRDAVEELREKAAAELKKLAESRLSAGFTYEYTRTETGTVLVEATLTEDALEEFHDELVDGDVSRLVELADHSPSVALERYRLEKRIADRRAWGFSLGSTMSGQDVRETELVVQEAILPADEAGVRRSKRVGYRGSLEYQGKWPDLAKGKSTWRWRGDLSAQMPGFSANLNPTLADFDFGLALLFDWSFTKSGEKALLPCLDAAALWGAIPDDRKTIEDEIQRFKSLEGKPVELRLELVVDHSALVGLLPLSSSEMKYSMADLAAALAAAMPYRQDDMRSSPATRRKAYKGLWEKALDEVADEHQGHLSSNRNLQFAKDYASKAQSSLSAHFKQEAAQEGNERIWRDFMWTFGGMVTINPFPLKSWRKFLQGFAQLTQGVRKQPQAGDYKTIKDMHALMNPFMAQSHWIRTLGRYLVDEAHRRAVPERLRASFTATVGKKGEGRQVLVLGTAID